MPKPLLQPQAVFAPNTELAEAQPKKAAPPEPEGYKKVDEFTLQKEERHQSTNQEKGPPVPQPQQPNLAEYDNLWRREDVPKTGRVCTGITDLGGPTGVCEMCGHQIIRYVHHMYHPDYRSLGVGCVCAGKMEGNIEQARKREQDFKSKQSRKDHFKSRQWKTSKNSKPHRENER